MGGSVAGRTNPRRTHPGQDQIRRESGRSGVNAIARRPKTARRSVGSSVSANREEHRRPATHKRNGFVSARPAQAISSRTMSRPCDPKWRRLSIWSWHSHRGFTTRNKTIRSRQHAIARWRRDRPACVRRVLKVFVLMLFRCLWSLPNAALSEQLCVPYDSRDGCTRRYNGRSHRTAATAVQNSCNCSSAWLVAIGPVVLKVRATGIVRNRTDGR